MSTTNICVGGGFRAEGADFPFYVNVGCNHLHTKEEMIAFKSKLEECIAECELKNKERGFL